MKLWETVKVGDRVAVAVTVGVAVGVIVGVGVLINGINSIAPIVLNRKTPEYTDIGYAPNVVVARSNITPWTSFPALTASWAQRDKSEVPRV